MRKRIEDVAVGDWVLGPSRMLDRYVGPALHVSEVKPKSVTGSTHSPNPLIAYEAVEYGKTIRRSSILFVFSTREEALAVSVKARDMAESLAKYIKQVKEADQSDFERFVNGFGELPAT